MKKLLLLVLLIFISCNSELSLEKKYEVCLGLNIAENNSYNEILKENIELRLSEITNEENKKKLKTCDSLSKEYLDYLTIVEKELKEKGTEIFFEGNLYSEKGKNYEQKSKKFKTEIEKLSKSANFIKRLNSVFGMNDIVTNDSIHIKYLDYFFKGYPKIQSSASINDKKRRVLEFENELIAEILSSSK